MSSKLISIPLVDLNKSSTVSFNLDDEIVKILLAGLRSSNESICSSSSSLIDEITGTNIEFKKTIKYVACLVSLVFLMAVLWTAYLW